MALIFNFKSIFKMLSAICFNLDQSKILSSGSRLMFFQPVGAGIPGSGSHYGRGTYSHRGIGRSYHLNFGNKEFDTKRSLDTITCFKVL